MGQQHQSKQVKRHDELLKMRPEVTTLMEFLNRLTEKAIEGHMVLLEAKTWGKQALERLIKTFPISSKVNDSLETQSTENNTKINNKASIILNLGDVSYVDFVIIRLKHVS